jgi:uncharacterized protein DUF6152
MRPTHFLALCALIGVPATAHHSGALYDRSLRVTVLGVVTRMEWANPHSHLYVKGQGASSGSGEWQFDLPSVNRLVRLGWTRHSVNEGDPLTVIGVQLRGVPHVAWAIAVIDGTGKKLFVDSPVDTSK